MVLSMTGYGRAEQVLNGRDIVVELRSVNSRFLNIRPVCPEPAHFWKISSKSWWLPRLAAARLS